MKLKLLILLFTITNLVFGQAKYDANWCFGVKAGINFNDTANPINFNTLSNAGFSANSISDSLGNLLFYIAPDTPFDMASVNNGVVNAIYDNTNKIILNGDSINVGADYNNGLILPVPAKKDSYLLFYAPWLFSNNGINEYNFGNLNLCKISKNIDAYAVTSKNQTLSSASIEFKLAAVKHGNGNDWWLLLHQSDQGVSEDSSDTFIEYLISSDSILGSIHTTYW